MSITSFKGDYSWLSNFYPVKVTYEDLTFPSVENAYQAAKTHADNRYEFTICTPGQSKRMGSKIQLLENWEVEKVDIMRYLLKQKFSNKYFLSLLLKTGSKQIIEGNYWGDTFWGVYKDKGENMLGKLIMDIRRTEKAKTTKLINNLAVSVDELFNLE